MVPVQGVPLYSKNFSKTSKHIVMKAPHEKKISAQVTATGLEPRTT